MLCLVAVPAANRPYRNTLVANQQEKGCRPYISNTQNTGGLDLLSTGSPLIPCSVNDLTAWLHQPCSGLQTIPTLTLVSFLSRLTKRCRQKLNQNIYLYRWEFSTPHWHVTLCIHLQHAHLCTHPTLLCKTHHLENGKQLKTMNC